MPKTIPQVREALLLIANEVDASQSRKIKRLVKSLYRRPAIRRAATEHANVTPQLRSQIAAYATLRPNASYAAIGREFNVSIGRVSEVIAGKRAA